MNEDEKKRYYGVALGALLHDIGKFMQRAEVEQDHPEIKQYYEMFCPMGQHGRHGYLHAAHTAWFIEKMIPDGIVDKTELYNAARHHINSVGDIFKEADCLSSGMERYGGEVDPGTYKDVRLRSIFDMIELHYSVRGRDGQLNSRWLHRLAPESEKMTGELYPVFSENGMLSDEGFNYTRLWAEFKQEVDTIRSANNIGTFFNEIYGLLEKYTGCIPSATNAFPDISLFDHSKTTAAIASSLFIFGQAKQNEWPEFILYGADISGIQNYIFKISRTEGMGGIAKRLRGRSFYISMLSEVLSRYIIDEVGLTHANINFCGGGNFELLLPNTEDVAVTLKNFNIELNSWLLEKFHGELGFVGSTVEMSRHDLRTRYAEKKDQLNDVLALAKQKKYRTHLNDRNFWCEISKSGGKRAVCRSCNLKLVDDKEQPCSSCSMDKWIGEKLPKANFIIFGRDLFDDDSMDFGKFGCVILSEDDSDLNMPGRETYVLNEDASGVKARFHLAQTVPVATGNIELDTEKDEDGDKALHIDQSLSFTTLADMATGDKRIGVLKMDVDNLGFIFSIGLEAPENLKNQGSLRSISRLSTLSRQITAFFTMHLDAVCRTVFERWKSEPNNHWEFKNEISNIFYLIFAGGDDLIIVGPWDQIIELASEIRKEFKNFTCHNPNITLSAGIYICKPKYPISHAAQKAEEALRKSKEKGKNRITVMGETLVFGPEDNRSRVFQKELQKRYAMFEKSEINAEKIHRTGHRKAETIPSLTFEELKTFEDTLNGYMKSDLISRNFIRSLVEAKFQFFPEHYNDEESRHEENQDFMFLPHLLYLIERNVKKDAREDLRAQLITTGDAQKYVRQAIFPCKSVLMKARK